MAGASARWSLWLMLLPLTAHLLPRLHWVCPPAVERIYKFSVHFAQLRLDVPGSMPWPAMRRG